MGTAADLLLLRSLQDFPLPPQPRPPCAALVLPTSAVARLIQPAVQQHLPVYLDFTGHQQSAVAMQWQQLQPQQQQRGSQLAAVLLARAVTAVLNCISPEVIPAERCCIVCVDSV